MATLMTYGPSFCYHDGFVGVDRFEDFTNKLWATPGIKIGNSDPANVFFWERINESFPDAKWIVIQRDFEETFRSCQKAFPEISRQILWSMADKLAELTAKLKPVVIDFDAITPNLCKMIARHCGVHAGSTERIEQLCRLNIQVDPKRLRQEIESLISRPSELLKNAA